MSPAVAKQSFAVPTDSRGYAYAQSLIYDVCCLAGCSSFIDDARDNLVNEGVLGAIEAHNTPVLFDWMVRAFSFQGIADGDLVAWIDTQLVDADDQTDPDRITRMIESLVGPLRQVYGVSNKVLMMTLSSLLLVSSKPLWPEVGACMIAVDTLVHNFLHRTGILHRLGANHPYG